MVEDGGGGEDFVVELVGGDEFELVGVGFEDEGLSAFVGVVDVAAGEEGGGAFGADAEAGFPEAFSGGGVPAVGPSAFGDAIEVIADEEE